MNILIAEDTPIIQRLYQSLMESWGFNYDIAVNGQEAVEYAKNNSKKYDLCLMDVDMPIMNGIDATRIIRKTMDYFPIMAITANDTYKKTCLDAGVDDFSTKPCIPENLLSKIIRLTVKYTKVDFSNKDLRITKEIPMTPQQAAVLKQLKEQNLSMISIFGTSTEATFVVNEAIPKYIENEFTESNKQSVRFLDHNPDGKGICCLFSKTSMVVKSFMLDEDFEIENQHELKKLNEMTVNIGD